MLSIKYGFKIFSISLIFSVSLSCDDGTNKQTEKITNSSFILSDYFDRKIQFNAETKRIIPLYYGECEIITALGAKDKVVGVGLLPQKSIPTYSYILDNYFPHIYEIPVVGGGPISIEKLLQLNPDVVLIDQRVEILNQMGKYKIKSFAIFPRNINDILDNIIIIGKISNKEDNAKILSDSLRNLLKFIKTKTTLLPRSDIPKVYYIWNSLLNTVNDSVHNEIFDVCGGVNVIKNEMPSAYTLTISLENLYKWNPDFIIIRDRSDLSINDILNDKNLKELKAVKNKTVFKEHNGWRGYKIETFFGIIEKSKWFHEELFKDINADNEYKKFLSLIDLFNK